MGRSIVSLDDLTPNNVGMFQKINQTCLPVTFPQLWYKESLEPSYIVQLGFYTELPVAAVKAKPFNLQQTSQSHSQQQQLAPTTVPNSVYVESLAVLPAYQNLGIGSKLLEYVLEETKKRYIHEVFLHVHAADTHAIEWYKKKGFEQIDVVKNYYQQQELDHPDAVVLKIKV